MPKQNTHGSNSPAGSTHCHAVASIVVLDRVHKVAHHHQPTTARTNSVFIRCRISDGQPIKTATFILNFDKDVVAEESVADPNMPTRVSTVAVSNGVDDGFMQAVPQRERLVMGNTPLFDSRDELVNFSTPLGNLTWDANLPEAVARHGGAFLLCGSNHDCLTPNTGMSSLKRTKTRFS